MAREFGSRLEQNGGDEWERTTAWNYFLEYQGIWRLNKKDGAQIKFSKMVWEREKNFFRIFTSTRLFISFQAKAKQMMRSWCSCNASFELAGCREFRGKESSWWIWGWSGRKVNKIRSKNNPIIRIWLWNSSYFLESNMQICLKAYIISIIDLML